MTPQELIARTKTDLDQLADGFAGEIRKFRTDRAHPSLVDNLMVEAYDSQLPLDQLAAIMVPEAKLIQIKPFDTANLEVIVAAVRADDQLGLNPTDDGQIIYLPIPPLTGERRQQLVKSLGQAQEACLVRLRHCRHEALKILKEIEASSSQEHRLRDELEDICRQAKNRIQQIAEAKRQELAG